MGKTKIIDGIAIVIISLTLLGTSTIFGDTNPEPSIVTTSSSMNDTKIAEANFKSTPMNVNYNEVAVVEEKPDNVELRAIKAETKEVNDVVPAVANETKNLSINEVDGVSEANVTKRSMDVTSISRGGTLNTRRLKSINEVAKDVINGNYGNGVERKQRLEAEGYNYSEIQQEVEKNAPKVVKAQAPVQANKVSAVQSGNTIKAYPHSTFKSYMSWTALSKSSPQGQLCAKAYKDNKTAIMMYDGRYLVALGKSYAKHIGEKIDVVMESGQVIPVMVGDWKATADTENNSTTKHDGSIIEFIVSSNQEASIAVNGSGSYNAIFPGKVKEFRK